jgi:hypothetical protein
MLQPIKPTVTLRLTVIQVHFTLTLKITRAKFIVLMFSSSSTKPSRRRQVIAWLIAGLLSFCFASMAHSVMVLSSLSELGVSISLTDYLKTLFADWLGLSTGYLPVISLGLLLGFTLMTWLNRWLQWSPVILYSFAGGCAMLAIHSLMFPIFHVTLIAGARDWLGFSLQISSGLLGGWCYARLSRSSLARPSTSHR